MSELQKNNPAGDKDLFFEALDIPNTADRAAFLERVCAGDLEKRRRLNRLLASHFGRDAFMEAPAIETACRDLIPEPPSDGSDAMIGRYKLLEKLGEGGFGVVYVAEQREPVKRRVALKIIKLGMDTRQVVARFEAERQALAMMDHPNIAKVLDAGAAETGRPYFVMELVRGRRITDFCEEKELSMPERLKLFTQVCQAIQHAHQKGIIHRDIKPSNILVTSHDGVPVPKVIDFGIAKAVEGDLTDKTIYTQYHHFIGTPAYMSPEQAEMSGIDLDTRTDIYALGVLLYELLTGTTPFDAKELLSSGIDEMRRIIREKDPVRPSTKLTQLSADFYKNGPSKSQVGNCKSQIEPDLDWIVMKCLEKDRTRRYETASALALDIQRFLNNEPVTAAAPSTSYRLRKFVRRNRAAVAVISTVAVLLFGGIVTTTLLTFWALRAERQALKLRDEQLLTNKELQEQLAATEREGQRADEEKAKAQRNLYAAHMNLVQQAAEQNDLSRLRRLLEEMKDYSDHGFEWFFWQQQLHRALKMLRGHISAVKAGTFSPDGTRIVTGSSDATAKVWDVESARELLSLEGHTAPIRCVAWSADARWIITGSDDHTAKVWNASSGGEVLSLRTPGSRVSALSITRDGREIVTGGSDGVLRVWQIPKGAERLKIAAHAGGIKSLALSPDGTRIATASADRMVKVWEIESGLLVATLTGHTGWVASVRFSPDGQRVLTASDDGTARVWDAARGTEILRLLGHDFYVTGADYSPDGTIIATSSLDRTLKLWDSQNGKALQTLTGHEANVNFVGFSPDGQWLLSGAENEWSMVWKIGGVVEPATVMEERLLAFSPDGQRIAVQSSDNTVRMLTVTPASEPVRLEGKTDQILTAAFSPDGRRFAMGDRTGQTKIWDVADGRVLVNLAGYAGNVTAMAYSPDSQRMATGGGDFTLRLWDTESGTEVKRIAIKDRFVRSLAFSPDGRRLASGGARGLLLWDAQTGGLIATIGPEDTLLSVEFSRDGKRILTSGIEHRATVWDANTGRALLIVQHPSWVYQAAFSPDNRRILTAGVAQGTVLWDASGQPLLAVDAGNSSAATFSPDGSQFASISGSTTRFWKAASAEQLAQWRANESAAVERIALRRRAHAERERLASETRATDEGAIKKWLILAPIPLPQGSSIDLHESAIVEAAMRHPRDGQEMSADGQTLVWKAAAFKSSVIDFNAWLPSERDWSAAYAVCYVHSEAERNGLRLLVGTDDCGKVFLNGKEIYSARVNRGFRLDEDTVENVRLKAGENILIFKVVNETAQWKGSIRFTDVAGNPVKGILVSVEAK